ncbi:tyrosylprotein sulfotransferase [Actinidia rufa]|uniref:Tyrosylprotein sulfotransferase n=1 Tax=Actinidia rufa TaxID=165716 RepID=A0A7J0GQP1_9ERIC|nr:tyrosylprotein sulfotransferase [Actinidia rufa]
MNVPSQRTKINSRCEEIFLFEAKWGSTVIPDCMIKNPILFLFYYNNFAAVCASATSASDSKDDYEHCRSTVKKWASSSLDLEVKEDKHTLRDLLYFLHIPRTGGRTYFHCKPNCRLLTTHDDYSMMSKLPKEKTSVMTILRNPVDRVFSTYEFSIEVAARFLVHPNLTSVTQMVGRLRLKNRGVSTLDIWPWKYLVPWMREDLFARRDARRHSGPTYIRSNDSYNMEEIVMPLQEYINDPIARDIIHNGATFQDCQQMLDCTAGPVCHGVTSASPSLSRKIQGSLKLLVQARGRVNPDRPVVTEPTPWGISRQSLEFLNSHLIDGFGKRETVIAGLTNNSYLAESHEVRRCVLKYQTLGEHVLDVAKKRLDDMLYVGLTEDHKESATMFANVVGAQVISQSIASNYSADPVVDNKSEEETSEGNGDLAGWWSLGHDGDIGRRECWRSECDKDAEVGGGKRRWLWVAEEESSSSLDSDPETSHHRNSSTGQKASKISSTGNMGATSKNARLQVPEVLLQEIKSLNGLDIKLYKYAQNIFSKQHKQMILKSAAAVNNKDS